MMKIAFDAKRAYLNNSGLGNYSRTLIKSLNEFHPTNQYKLYTTKESEGPFQNYVSQQQNMVTQLPDSFLAKKLKALWRSFGLTKDLKRNQVNVFHGLSNELPFNIEQFDGKKVVTIHDLIFLAHPELYPFIDGKIYNTKFRHACHSADTIIAISQATKDDIIKFYNIAPEKIEVVYQSCDDLYYQECPHEKKDSVIKKHNLPDNYLLYVGTVEERKNLITIVKSLVYIKDIKLVVAGRHTDYIKTVKAFIDEHQLVDRVIFLGSVDGQDLPALYQLATIFILPSIMEGFGIPIIEAQTSKTPVITTIGGCFSEPGGPHSIYVQPKDEKELASKITFLLENPDEREKMIEAGIAYTKRFHPEVITQQLMDVYTK